MAKNSVADWSTSAASNSDVGGINLAEGCQAKGINNALREGMAQIATWRDDLPYLTFNPQTGAYVLAATDAGDVIPITTGGVTVPANGTVALDNGFACAIINNSGSAQTITEASGVTLRWAGTTLTGNRNLAARGFCTLFKLATDEWYIVGAGLS